MSSIDDVIEQWEDSKKKVSYYEKQCDKYRDAIERHMNKKEVATLKSSKYTVTRRSDSREILPKQSIPVDIWSKYAKKITYYSYHIKNL